VEENADKPEVNPAEADTVGKETADKVADEADDVPVPKGTAPVENEAPAAVPAHDTAPEKPTAPAVSLDDITKVIVAKIKQKRSNNAKIGSLLKTYGADKVSDLPQEKYEAFLTDISQI